MPVTKVSSLHIYPIKSTAGILVPDAAVEELGLAFDRRFVVSDTCGQFITARTEPRLCLVKTDLSEQGITLSAPNMPALVLSYVNFTNQYQNVTVWDDEISGQLCSEKANSWFSDYLQRPCKLLFFGSKSYREKKPNTDEARKVAFADGYPLLLISQASLNGLNQHLMANEQETVSMAQFRPNIVVDDCLPFAEDEWQHIRIGEVEFTVSKPCERCIFTTVNPGNAEMHPQQQPLRTLKSYRQTSNGEVLFGQNLIALNNGQIKTGDKLTVISKQKSPTFTLNRTSSSLQTEPDKSNIENKNSDNAKEKPVNKKLNIHFETWDKLYKADNQKTILEHGEDAGLILPYSCRAGMCGRCKAKLISGEVIQSATDGLTTQQIQEGYILCCSSIPQTDVIIKSRN